MEHLGDLMLRQLDLDGALRHYLEALELGFERADFLALKVADTYRLQQKPALALAYYPEGPASEPGPGKGPGRGRCGAWTAWKPEPRKSRGLPARTPLCRQPLPPFPIMTKSSGRR